MTGSGGSGSGPGGGGSGVGEIRLDASRCPVCFRHFDDRWKLERHARVHTGERPFACSRCTKTFTRKEHLTRHELSHDGGVRSTPPAGGSTAGTQAAVNALVLYRGAEDGQGSTVSTRGDGYRCPVCFRHFGDRWKLERHARVHTGERPFSCGRCGNSFRRKEHLVRHERSHDGGPPNTPPAGGSTAGTHAAVNALVLYRGAEGGEGSTVAVRGDGCRCPVCFRHFGDRWKLERHARVHTGERPFSCGRCGNAFRRKEHLVRHERSHDGEKLFSCSVCGKAFVRKDYVAPLNAHHPPGGSGSGGNTSGVDGYRGGNTGAAGSGTVALRVDACRCPVCFRHFGDRWKLERHARVHTGERPFTCGRCGKSFTTKEHLVRHEMSHAGEKPYSCSVCGKAFTRKDHVDRHFKKTHCRPKYTDL
ncbi:zinc finger protein-like [Tropilaelaps mercedesae]|uniref:Zinc finger protein-like n=1 Tax=Tropilaelaps mercedesae TaxID=418985 RepID=A0A1V9Y2U6_9ACAR|nr:zinc finger protein-like [Tropilaelaps mercedesae]